MCPSFLLCFKSGNGSEYGARIVAGLGDVNSATDLYPSWGWEWGWGRTILALSKAMTSSK